MLPNTPLTAFESARLKWFDVFGNAVVEKRRYFVVSLVLGVASTAQAMTILAMLPLKTVQPYVVQVSNDGHYSANPVGAQPYEPKQPEKQYFLAQWSTKLLTLDRFMTQRYLSDAYLLTRDKAPQQFTDWIAEAKPIEAITRDPSLSQTVTIRSVSFVQEGAALVRLTTDRRSLQGKSERQNVLLTIHFQVIPPKSEKEILENPIGLYVTHFAINEDLT